MPNTGSSIEPAPMGPACVAVTDEGDEESDEAVAGPLAAAADVHGPLGATPYTRGVLSLRLMTKETGIISPATCRGLIATYKVRFGSEPSLYVNQSQSRAFQN
jgi:hypothetical protein